MAGSPCALAPKRKFSPTETRSAPSRSTSTSSMNSSALRWANSRSKGITTSSRTPRPSITSRLTPKGMISFGSAAGWRISSGWGSKVRTVSASSITAWWPRWTPSKVPIATWRGRGSASGSEVTWMLTATPSGALYPPMGPKGAPEAHRGPPRRRGPARRPAPGQLPAGVLDAEGPDRGAAQLGAVGVVEGLDQGADVGAGGALDLVFGAFGAAGEQLGAVDLDLAFGGLDHLAAVGLAVEALAADPHRRGHRHPLAHPARGQLQRTRHAARSRSARRRGRRCSSASPAAPAPRRSSAAR